jgi:TatD DNase family protein
MQYSGLVDIGVNLTHARFDGDRAAVIQRATDAGVAGMIITGVSVDESRAAAALATQYPDLMAATAGVHPHHAQDWTPASAAALAALLDEPANVAVGETGLDYNRDFSPRAEQRAAFEAQLRLAADHQRPVFLHQRDAEADFLALLRDYRPALPGAVLHCFTGDRAMIEACRALDLHFGITGWVGDERRGAALREGVADIPDNRLMIETDAPFLLPAPVSRPWVKRRNEPAYLAHVLNAVAALRDQTPAALAALTEANSRRFFNWPSPASGPRPDAAPPAPGQ